MAISLMLHQVKGVKYLEVMKGRGALFMEMRLGKTLTAISYIIKAGCKKVLIISPYSVIDSWADDFKKIDIHPENYALLKGTRPQRLQELNRDVKWTVGNYESAERLGLHKIKWDVVVLDESIKIANPKSKIAKYLLANFKGVPKKIVLCGNPAPENLLQYVTQYLFFKSDFMGAKSYWIFRNRNYLQIGFDWVPMPDVSVKISRYIHNSAFLLTRKDAGIGSRKLYQARKVEMDPAQKKEYKSMEKFFECGEREEKNTLGQITSLSRIAGGCSCEFPHSMISDKKASELLYLLRHDLKGQKVLIWCRFVSEAEQLSDFLNYKSLATILITGDVKQDERRARRKIFIESKVNNIAVMTIASSAKGQDWSVADTAIYYSNEYSNDLRTQSEDRICHPEKKTPLLIIDLLTENSIDEKVLAILKDKKFDNRLFMSRLIKELKPI